MQCSFGLGLCITNMPSVQVEGTENTRGSKKAGCKAEKPGVSIFQCQMLFFIFFLGKLILHTHSGSQSIAMLHCQLVNCHVFCGFDFLLNESESCLSGDFINTLPKQS